MNTLTQLVSKVTLHELFNPSHFPNGAPFSKDLLDLDCGLEAERICAFIRSETLHSFRKKGVIVGVSGGIDSSTVAALAVRALGPNRVIALLMPEKDSSADTLELSQLIVEHLGIRSVIEDISPALEAAGCYRRRDDAIRLVVPEYGAGWKSKLVLPNVVNSESLRIFSVVARRRTALKSHGHSVWKHISELLPQPISSNALARCSSIIMPTGSILPSPAPPIVSNTIKASLSNWVMAQPT